MTSQNASDPRPEMGDASGAQRAKLPRWSLVLTALLLLPGVVGAWDFVRSLAPSDELRAALRAQEAELQHHADLIERARALEVRREALERRIDVIGELKVAQRWTTADLNAIGEEVPPGFAVQELSWTWRPESDEAVARVEGVALTPEARAWLRARNPNAEARAGAVVWEPSPTMDHDWRRPFKGLISQEEVSWW